MNSLILFWFLTLNLAVTSSSTSGALFKVYDLEFEGDLSSYHVEDLNNDGLKDILLFQTRGANEHLKERWLSLYLQTENGYLKAPDQTFQLSDKIILFDIGDVSGDLNKEFVFFMRDGVYYYNLNNRSFTLHPHKLFDTDSIFMLSNHKTFEKWDFVTDLNGDSIEEVFIPKITKSEIYFRNPIGENWLITAIPLGAESKVSGFYDKRFSVGNKAEANYSTPYILVEDFNADGRNDLIGVYTDSLVVFSQDENGYFSLKCHHKIDLNFGEIWRGAKIQRTRIGDKSERYFLKRILDLNADGIIDIISIKISTRKSFVNPYNEVRIHFGKKDTSNSANRIYFNQTPDQIIKPDGTQLVLDILDLNRDKKYDLVIPVVKVGLKNIISMLLTKSVEIQAETYLMHENGLYSEKPDFNTNLVVRFSFRGGATSPVYEIADFNDDGYLDILSSIEEKMLIIFWGNKKNIIDSKVGAKYNVLLPQNGEMVRAMNLNADNKCDIIITYNEDNATYHNLTKILRVLIAN